MIDRASLALELYVTWSSGTSAADRSRERWRLMPEFGKRPFFELADRALALMSISSNKCPCGAAPAIAGRCMACASREAE